LIHFYKRKLIYDDPEPIVPINTMCYLEISDANEDVNSSSNIFFFWRQF